MNTLIEYIGPIIFIVLIISYSIYRRCHPKNMDTKQVLKCPKCNSVNLAKYTPKKQGYSPRDAIIGHAVGGKNGAIFALLYESDKSHFHCRFCGHRFAVKENRFVKEM
ncbi:TPA: hypothetical protein U2D09_000505 [Streptococcus suis]|nr:hypothetical protein [Streptococcus suis]HEM6302335.1 hypothetical protein [Streptococcus suis]